MKARTPLKSTGRVLLGTATPDRSTSALLDAQCVLLLRPFQWQVDTVEQGLGAEFGWLLSLADRPDDIWMHFANYYCERSN